MPHIPSHLLFGDFGPDSIRDEPFGTVRDNDSGFGQTDFTRNNPFDSPFLDFFETTDLGRRAQFQATRPANQTAGQRRFSPFAFEDAMNSFLRRLGTQFNTGQVPNATFAGELASQFSTPGQQQRRRARAPVFQSGLGTSGLVGSLRRLFNQ